MKHNILTLDVLTLHPQFALCRCDKIKQNTCTRNLVVEVGALISSEREKIKRQRETQQKRNQTIYYLRCWSILLVWRHFVWNRREEHKQRITLLGRAEGAKDNWKLLSTRKLMFDDRAEPPQLVKNLISKESSGRHEYLWYEFVRQRIALCNIQPRSRCVYWASHSFIAF